MRSLSRTGRPVPPTVRMDRGPYELCRSPWHSSSATTLAETLPDGTIPVMADKKSEDKSILIPLRPTDVRSQFCASNAFEGVGMGLMAFAALFTVISLVTLVFEQLIPAAISFAAALLCFGTLALLLYWNSRMVTKVGPAGATLLEVYRRLDRGTQRQALPMYLSAAKLLHASWEQGGNHSYVASAESRIQKIRALRDAHVDARVYTTIDVDDMDHADELIAQIKKPIIEGERRKAAEIESTPVEPDPPRQVWRYEYCARCQTEHVIGEHVIDTKPGPACWSCRRSNVARDRVDNVLRCTNCGQEQ